MKEIILAVFIVATQIACTSKGASSKTEDKPDNYIVILDLSDRLTTPNQSVIDTSVIRACLEKFESSVQRHLVVKSKDKFSIRIIPQQNPQLPVNNFENSLSIDMGTVNAAEKLRKLNEFKTGFGTAVKMLYQQAYVGNETNAYAGVDIWQYFNEQINTDFTPGYNNKVVVLTDGYFDFEDRNRGLSNSHQSTVTKHLLAQLNDLNWKEKAEANNIALLPVSLPKEAQFVVAGIQPKTNDLLETEKLTYLWEKWLRMSGAENVVKPIANASSGKMKALVKIRL